MAQVSTTGVAPGSHQEGSPAFRPDIQGLRALAVLLVVVDHFDIGPVRGGYLGVDVFFVVSGFLITGLLLGEADRRGKVSLGDFYARRARRILPAATLVLGVTAVAGYFVLNGIDALRLFKDTIWAMFFAANFKFASDETDYFAQDDATSPIQHYWSLAVEEQFYLVWPLLVLLLVAVFGRRGRSRRAIVVTIGVLSLASFAWAVATVGENPQGAYFSTPARVWELGLGAGLAAAMLRVRRVPPALLATASWVGLVMIGYAALTFTPQTAVPAAPALVPILGTVLVLGGGVAAASWGPQWLLSVAPARWIGDRSYSFYLWHWPALILIEVAWQPLSGWTGLAVAAGALVLADLSYRFVENPFRERAFFKPRLRGLVLYPVSVAMLAGLIVIADTSLQSELNEGRPPITVAAYCDEGEDACDGNDPQTRLVEASVLAAERDDPIPNPLTPRALGLADKVAADLGECEYFDLPDPMPLCERGDVDGSKTLVAVGDSHLRHWIPALDPVVTKHGYRAFYFPLQGCTPALVLPFSPYYDAPDTNCVEFHEWTQEQIERLRPDVVVMSTDTQYRYVDDAGEYVDDKQEIAAMIEEGMVERIEQMRPHVGRIVIIADPPRLTMHPSVVSERGVTMGDVTDKPLFRSMLMRKAVKAAAKRTGVEHIETKQWFCADNLCPVVIGEFITRRDYGHISLEYAESLSQPLERALALE